MGDPEGGGLEAEQRGGAARGADPPAGMGARPPKFGSFSEGSCVFKVRSLQQSVITMTGEYRTAEKGRKDLEEKSRQHPMPAAS